VTQYLGLDDVLQIHSKVLAHSGGLDGILNPGMLDSAIAQPSMMFGGQDLYPSIHEKAAALGFSLIKNHCFCDGNKRVGRVAMEVFLIINGHEISAPVDEQEKIILAVASGEMQREPFTEWLKGRIVARS
jgi:death-on-curing protein